MQRYDLYLWPDSQTILGNPGAILVLPPEDPHPDYGDLDSAYLVPDNEGVFAKVEWPDNQGLEDDPANILDYDGNVYVRSQPAGETR